MRFGGLIGRHAPGGSVLAFRGDLGAGKTTMTRGIARGLGIDEIVTSPTYTIVAEYRGRLRLCHVDAWRLHGPGDFDDVGGFETLSGPDTLCVIEWSERLGSSLPASVAILEIRVAEDGSRTVAIEGDWLERILDEHPGV